MVSRTALRAGVAAAAILFAATAARAHDEIAVVATIKPIHSLVAGVMEGVGTPALIVKGAASPHAYSMRPSEARALERADVVFWVGEDLETFLTGTLDSLARDARVVALSEAPQVRLLPFRADATFERHAHAHADADGHGHAADAHDDHAHEEHAHDEHAHEEHAHEEHAHEEHAHEEHAHEEHAHEEHAHEEHANEEHAHEEHAHEEHAHDDHAHDDHAHDDHGHADAAGAGAEHAAADGDAHAHGHDHGDMDMHVWLDPRNAAAMTDAIAAALAEADPDHAALYRENAKAQKARLAALEDEIAERVAPVAGEPFVVFHDAYHYFEDRFGLEAAGAITVSPEIAPGAGRLSEIRARIETLGATCVFAEPQFEPRVVSVVTEGTDARTGVLDPLGADVDAGADHYFALLRALADDFAGCLGGTG